MKNKNIENNINKPVCVPVCRDEGTGRQRTGRGEIVIYKSPSGPEIQVKLEKDTIWLDAHLIAKIFDVNRPTIVKHINNIYKTGELDKKSTCSILEQVAADGKIRKTYLYRENGEKKINDNALVALALLIVESDPKEKDILIKIITKLIGA